MKQLLFLLLFPAFAMAQYPGNANQKITLGEQTTADGLVYRGVASIDTVTATSKITRANKQDTSTYILLDTVTNLLWHYKTASNGWIQAGGSTLDTATMLLPYYRAGRNTIIQAADVPTLNQNTTGSAATLTTGRTIQTNLASTSAATFNGSANITPGVTGTLPVANGGTNTSTLTANKVMVGNGTSGVLTPTYLHWDNSNERLGIGTTSPQSKLDIVNSALSFGASPLKGTGANIVGAAGSGVGGGDGAASGVLNIIDNASMAANNGGTITLGGNYISSGNSYALTYAGIKGGKENATDYNSAGYLALYTTSSGASPAERMRITSGGEVWIGYTTDQGAYRLQVQDSVYVGGNVSASAYTTRSDYDLKDEIQNISYGINEVMQMQPVKYTYKSNGSTQLGFIAQDLGVITPEVVSFEDKMSVYYNALIPILTKAIQEQQALIKALEQRIINLENK